jgi:REP element-mobilizing transposase RayT
LSGLNHGDPESGRFVNRPYGIGGSVKFNPDIHGRHSIRLEDYDYSRSGAYFVTVCIFERQCLLGEVVDGEMRLSEAGLLVETIWHSLPQRYQGLKVDALVVMPNHLHGIVVINDFVGAIHELPRQTPMQRRRAMTLSKVIGYLKMNSAKQINLLRGNSGLPLWQRNYYERVIRDDHELDGIRQYIADNPAKWEMDENHPART